MSLLEDLINISVSGSVSGVGAISFSPSAVLDVSVSEDTEFSTFNSQFNIGVDVDVDDTLVTIRVDTSDTLPTLTIGLTGLDPFGVPEGQVSNISPFSAPDPLLASVTWVFNNQGSIPIEFEMPNALPGEYVFQLTMECFLTGTHILAEQGEVAVEELSIGDLVQTADGSLQPIKWIGKQTLNDLTSVPNPLRVHPILIKARALGNNLPHRDLYVSPDHALLVDGLLINAGALVNGVSIIQTTPTEGFTYYHVELNHHGLLIAEGTCAESYLPQKEDRSNYDNGDEYAILYPHDNILAYWPMKYPRVSSKRQLPRFVSKTLLGIANDLAA